MIVGYRMAGVAPLLFVYGSLRDPEVRTAVIGRDLPIHDVSAAWLDGHRLFRIHGRSYPMIVADPRGTVEGQLLTNLSRNEFRLLDAFEGSEYRRCPVSVRDATGRHIGAQLYQPLRGLKRDRRPWSLNEWSSRERRAMLARARIWRQCGRWTDNGASGA